MRRRIEERAAVFEEFAPDEGEQRLHLAPRWHEGDEQVAQGGGGDFAQGAQQAAIDAIKDYGGHAEAGLAVDGAERLGGGQLVGLDDQLGELARHGFHLHVQDQLAIAHEHDVGEHELDLIHLVGGDEQGALLGHVVLEQAPVEALAIGDVEAERGLVEDEEFGIDRHHHGEVELGDHALAQILDARFHLHVGAFRGSRGPSPG